MNDPHLSGATEAAEGNPPASGPVGPARAVADAAARGLEIELVQREGSGRPTSSEQGGVPIVKTIVVQRGESFVFVLTRLEDQFSWPKLRAHLGVNKLSLPDADAAFAATGYVRGTITPLGSTTAWPVIIEAGLAGQEMLLGAGAPGTGARVSADALAEAFGAEFVDLRK